jgi:phage terminase small subunit
MPVLGNAKQERFAQEVAGGKSSPEAYALAGYKPDRKNAHSLRHKVVVARRITALLTARADRETIANERLIGKLVLSKEWVLSRLKENVERAMEAVEIKDSEGRPSGFKYEGSVANRALELLGRHVGLFIDKAPGSDETTPMFVKWLE